ncbi:MAG TPA: hypothetical protein VMY16_13255 [Ilumatobacteraceae bacterium]|nr:hypothetical protein [Ilumatobacteraceae bacterium]
MASSGPQRPTSAERWAEAAHRAIEASGPAGLSDLLAEEFVQESHRSGPIEIRREGLLGTVQMMKEMGLHVAGEPVAVAGDLHLLMHRRYLHERETVELLAISAWNADGRLVRLVEYDARALDEALVALAELSGEPIVRLDDSG